MGLSYIFLKMEINIKGQALSKFTRLFISTLNLVPEYLLAAIDYMSVSSKVHMLKHKPRRDDVRRWGLEEVIKS